MQYLKPPAQSIIKLYVDILRARICAFVKLNNSKNTYGIIR